MSNNRRLNNRKGGAEVLLLGCFIFILFVVGAGALIAGYLGFIPAISKLLGTDKPRDLGVKYANINVMKVHDYIGTKTTITKDVSGSGAGAGLLFEGSKPAKYSLTGEELTALANSPWKYFPFSDVQIKIDPDGTVEASAMLRTDRIINFAKSLNFNEKEISDAIQKFKIPVSNTPVYAKGNFSVEEGKAKINPQNIEIGKASLPLSVIEKIIPQITDGVNSIIKSFPGFYIKNLTFSEGKMNFEGTVPAKQTIYE